MHLRKTLEMSQNIIDTQMDKYLMNVRRKIAATLECIEEHGVTIDDEFEKYLINASKDR